MTNVLGQDTESPPVICIDDCELDAVGQFTYLGSATTDNISLDTEIDKRIGKAGSTLARLTAVDKPQADCEYIDGGLQCLCYQRIAVWQRDMDYIIYAGQERRLNKFHLRTIRRILRISWHDKVTNTDVLSRAGLPSMYTLLRPRRLRWLGHVRRMEDGRIPKYILYDELVMGRRTIGRPHLQYKDVCVRDMKAVDIDTMSWEGLAADRTKRRSALKQHLKTGEDKLMTAAADKRARRNEGSSSIRPETTHYVLSATNTATPTLDLSAINEAVTTQQGINKTKSKNKYIGCIIHGPH